MTQKASGTSNPLTISGNLATFTTPLPVSIGVGDALEYDSDNNGSIDQIVFISKRMSNYTYLVYTASGNFPVATSASDNDWKIFRAYTSLANVNTGTENTGIDINVQNFDMSGTHNLVSNNETWHIALYASATPDTSLASFPATWTTGPGNDLQIFSPFLPRDVGLSQRHQGIWAPSTAYRLQLMSGPVNAAALTIATGHVKIEGIQISTQASTNGQKAINIDLPPNQHRIVLRDNIITGSNAGNYQDYSGIYFFDHDTNNTGDLILLNNVIYGFTGATIGQNRCFYSNAGFASLYLYNNTMVDCGMGIYLGTALQSTLVNNLVIAAASEQAYCYNSGGCAATGVTGSNNLGSDNLTPSLSVSGALSVQFVSTGTKNYRISGSDTIARYMAMDLANAPVFPFDQDILGNLRGAQWSIGAFEP